MSSMKAGLILCLGFFIIYGGLRAVGLTMNEIGMMFTGAVVAAVVYIIADTP